MSLFPNRNRRVWRYSYREWQPRWLHWLVPYRGNDEWGRFTFVVPAHPFGWLVWAYRTCWCAECDEVREQTARWEAEDAAERSAIANRQIA